MNPFSNVWNWFRKGANMPDHHEEHHATPIVVSGRIEHCHHVDGSGIGPIHVHLHDDGKAAHAEILERLGTIMSAISQFILDQKQFNKDTGDGIDTIVTSLGNIDGDVKSLNDQIANLTVSPADVADLEQLKADGLALGVKVKTARDIAAALDAKTPPVAPPTP